MKIIDRLPKQITSRLLMFISGLFILLSCTDETIVSGGGSLIQPKDGEVVLRLTLNTPATQSSAGTKAGDITKESAIDNIRVLVFELKQETGEYLFLYGAGTSSLAHNGTSTNFTATVRSSATPVKLVFIANATDEVTGNLPMPGDTETEVKRMLVKNAGNTDALNGYLPMYGEYKMASIQAENQNNVRIKMLRAVARADIYNEAAGFTAISAQVFRSFDKIRIIPDDIGNATSPRVTSPSLAESSLFHPVTHPMPEAFFSGDNFFDGLYLPESAAPEDSRIISDATCIVVGGLYKGQKYYYRIDFSPANAATGEILRNHQYIFTIRKVTAEGWPTPEEAARNISTNIVAEVEPWDSNTTDMYFDGAHYYGVSAREVILKYRANSTNTIKINSDLTGEQLQWCDENGHPLSESKGTSLESSRFRVGLGESEILFTAKEANTTDEAYSEYMLIHISRWKILITITQHPNLYKNEYVSVLCVSPGNSWGDLTDGGTFGTGNWTATRKLLDANFGPGKTIDFQGLNYRRIGVSASNITSEINDNNLSLEVKVLVMGYTAAPSEENSAYILNWLAANKNRVLIIETDNTTMNKNILARLSGDIAIGSNSSAGSLYLPFNVNPTTDYFMKTGPFTAGGNEIDACNAFMVDGVWESFAVKSKNIIRLIDYKGDMVLGVDPARRIVYVGDGHLLSGYTGSNAERKEGQLIGANGELSNDYSRIMANLWAWIVEEVVFKGN